jgi:hypothetical protein
MKNIIFTMFAVALAGIAAIAATTAMLNAPVAQHIGPPASDKPAEPGTPPATPPESPPATPAPSGDQPTPAPQAPAPEAGKPAGEAGKDAAGKDEEIVADEDPYEGIAPEDLPPDLQYDADSSVSFPTNI